MEVSFWEHVETGRFSDLTIVEQFAGGTAEYTVHKIVLYNVCPYFIHLMDSNMKDANSLKITINTNLGVPILETILHAIYSPCNVDDIYEVLVDTKDVDVIMEVYATCDFLGLTDHLSAIDELLTKLPVKLVIDWLKQRHKSNLLVPDNINKIVMSFLLGANSFSGQVNSKKISLSALLYFLDSENIFFQEYIHDLLKKFHTNYSKTDRTVYW